MNTDGPLTFTGLIKFLQYIKGPDHWHTVGATGEPAFENSWENHGLGNQVARFMKDASGVVYIQGVVKNATPTGVIFTLPSAYWSDNFLPLPVSNHNYLAGVVGIDDDGTVTYVYGATPNNWYSISCSFYVG